ncbi:MAG: hypothetical protein IPG44_11330 [Anaerolineales bacterium]|jgi:hypothetical protein|nr:hypothetical protein [Chloroflexota bacterium]MBK6646316.1 hypothetical protein [Anaerolineales bacterium]MCC6986265.1 hypothetical protein [Anaerolineales bacterium]
MRYSHRLTLILTAAVFTLACLPALGAAATPLPTFDANAPLTAIAQTAGVAATQTAMSVPTATPTIIPTRTPTDTPSPTPTFLFLVPTQFIPPTQVPIGSSNLDFDCQVISFEPQEAVAASSRFFGKWLVANIGRAAWNADNVDYQYVDGDKLHLQSIYDFPASVQPGGTVEITVDMQAPAEPGEYYTRWRINAGKEHFCPMDLRIKVY